jgi:hypothetical protein
MSRGMSLRVPEYYTLFDLKNKKLSDVEKKNNDINAYMGKNVGAPCIVPYIDLCNHYQPKYDDLRDKKPIILDTEKDYFVNTMSSNVNYGDEVSYTYTNEPSNLIMYMHYGFIMRNNIFNFAQVLVIENDTFTPAQFSLGKQIGAIDPSVKDSAAIPKIKTYRIKIHSGDKELINYARVKFLTGEFDNKEVLKKLLKNEPISFNNEMSAWIWYYQQMILTMTRDGHKISKSIKKAQHISNKLKQLQQNWIDNVKSKKELTSLKHYETEYKLDISYKLINIRHSQLALNKIVLQISDEIGNLKDLYINH